MSESGSAKPSYLGLLNAVANAEAGAEAYLLEWAAVTPRPDVRSVLLKIAAREGEHAASFSRRINELGYQLRKKDDGRTAETIELVRRTDCSDRDKMHALKLDRLDTGTEPDIFDNFFKDHTIDIQTGELLGRYIAEERDTGRILRHCYELLEAEEAQQRGAAAATDRLASLEAKVDALAGTVEQLCAAVAGDAPAGNGRTAKSRAKSAK